MIVGKRSMILMLNTVSNPLKGIKVIAVGFHACMKHVRLELSESLGLGTISGYGENRAEVFRVELDDVDEAIEILEETAELANTAVRYLKKVKRFLAIL